MRVSPEQNHSWDDMVLKEMLVRNASLYKPDTKFLDELSHQVMKIGDLLIWSGERMINHEMDLRWVPDSRDTHLAEDFDCEGSCAILSHGKVGGNYSNVSGVMGLLPTTRSDANDLLRKGKCVIGEDVLMQ